MMLITLNVWGGRVRGPLRDFLESHQDADIFCFQEVFCDAHEKDISEVTDYRDQDLDTFGTLSSALPDHTGIFCPVIDDLYGIAIFIRKGIEIAGHGDVLLYDAEAPLEGFAKGMDHSRKMQWVMITSGRKEYLIMNVHGHWTNRGKGDDTDRIEQSKRILGFSDGATGAKILAGDFNLRPDTESIHMIESKFRDHIVENHVASTRTKLYTGKERHADFVFTSGVDVKGFAVLPDEPSDHAPLSIEFE